MNQQEVLAEIYVSLARIYLAKSDPAITKEQIAEEANLALRRIDNLHLNVMQILATPVIRRLEVGGRKKAA